MKKIIAACLIVVLVWGVAIAQKAPDASPAKFTAKVVDEDGKPLEGMNISAAFVTEESHLKGVTDVNGLFVAKCKRAMLSNAGFSVNKPGYYETHVGFYYDKIVGGRWEPWDPVVTAVVRRIVNPIPMYAKHVETKIPAENTDLGFDLRVGDWISPHGGGQQADLVFYFSRRISGDRDCEGKLKLLFARPYDGILENKEVYLASSFRLPRFAPQGVYSTNWSYRVGEDPKTGYFGLSQEETGKSHFFRVRSIVDENGKLKEALYGKVVGIRVRGVARSTGADIIFTYYLNPTPNDRNMEFDPKRNLMKGLKSTEKVGYP